MRLEVKGSVAPEDEELVVSVQVDNRGDSRGDLGDHPRRAAGPARRGARRRRAWRRGSWTEAQLRFPQEGVEAGRPRRRAAPRLQGRTRSGAVASQAAYLLLALGANPPPAVRVFVGETTIETRGRVPVSLESADGRPHVARLRLLTPRGLNPYGEAPDVAVPAQGRVHGDARGAARQRPRETRATASSWRRPPSTATEQTSAVAEGAVVVGAGPGAHAAPAHPADGRVDRPAPGRDRGRAAPPLAARRLRLRAAVLHATTDPEGVVFLRLARTVAGRPLYRGGAYLLGNVLLDCGPPGHRARRALLARPAGRSTRCSSRTTTRTTRAARRCCARARAGRRTSTPPASRRWRTASARSCYRRLVWGRPAPVEARPLPPVVDTGAVRLEVVETPGHSPDHVCFYDRSRGWLFTGDLFLGERQRYLRGGRGPRADSSPPCAPPTALPIERGLLRAPRAAAGRSGGAPARRLDHLRTVRDQVPRAAGAGAPGRRGGPARRGARGPDDLDQPRPVLGPATS